MKFLDLAFLVMFFLSVAYLANLLVRVYVTHQIYAFDFGFVFFCLGVVSFGFMLLTAYWVYHLNGNPEALENEDNEA